LGKPYDDLVVRHDKYSGILKRNPTLVKTAPLARNVLKVRSLLGVLNKSLQVAGAIGSDAGASEALETVSDIAAPYLKTKYSATMLALLADAGDMCVALREPAVAQKVSTLGLTAQVAAIKGLVDQCNDLLDIRGEEKEYRKRLGSASKARTALQKHYRQLFITVIPGIYLLATDPAVKAKLIELINHINATLDIFRHLTTGSGDWESDIISDEDTRPDPTKPDTQPADPPYWGSGIDPDA
jgi:hypothetical protein